MRRATLFGFATQPLGVHTQWSLGPLGSLWASRLSRNRFHIPPPKHSGLTFRGVTLWRSSLTVSHNCFWISVANHWGLHFWGLHFRYTESHAIGLGSGQPITGGGPYSGSLEPRATNFRLRHPIIGTLHAEFLRELFWILTAKLLWLRKLLECASMSTLLRV